ncbi:MAG: 2-oxo-4-hydroxy-4-carboxy-5-ureidoimidazoline decarboxylase [Pseudomonadota bacterium]
MTAQTLATFNALSADEARQWLEGCCAEPQWAAAVAAERPFHSTAELLAAARAHWGRATEAQRLTAFAAHPLIGDVELLRERYAQAGDRANAEQGQVLGADEQVLTALAERNREYYERHGFIFIVFASGKSAAEMLALLEARLPRTRAQELATAAQEQMKITALRIEDRMAQDASAARAP